MLCDVKLNSVYVPDIKMFRTNYFGMEFNSVLAFYCVVVDDDDDDDAVVSNGLK